MSLALVELPPEILELVFAQVTRRDVKSLASTCQHYRKKLLPYIMRSLHVTWAQVLELHTALKEGTEINLRGGSGPKFSARLYCERLLITSPDPYNEYHSDPFGKLLAPSVFPNLHDVCVHSASQSHWLKYNKCTHIRSLSLVNVDTSRNIKDFYLSHVADFVNLRRLTLHNYHFDWSEEDLYAEDYDIDGSSDSNGNELHGNSQIASRPALKIVPLFELNLHDCTWEYPFNLALFNTQDTLRTLSITYSRNNSFILSERFSDFLKQPFPRHSDSIRNLSIGFVNYTENKKLLTSVILDTLLRDFSGLDHLYLYGWYTTEVYIKTILANITFNIPVDVDVELENNVYGNVPASFEHPSILRWKKRLSPK